MLAECVPRNLRLSHQTQVFMCHYSWLSACPRTSPCSGCLPGSTSGCWEPSFSLSPSTFWSSMWSLCQWVSLRCSLDIQNTLMTLTSWNTSDYSESLSLSFSWSSRWPPCTGPNGLWCWKFHSQWSSWMKRWNIFPGTTLKVCLEIHMKIQN